VKETVFAMAVEERHANFELRDDWRRSCFPLAGGFGVEDCLATLTAGGRRREVK
jgi:hypothetical protein